MSLLADLLSGVKHDKQEQRAGGVPPTLQKIISESRERKSVGKPFMIAGALALAIVAAGLAIVYYMGSVAEPTLKNMAARRDSPRPPVDESLREQSEAPRPKVERPPDKPVEEAAPRAERQAPANLNPAGKTKKSAGKDEPSLTPPSKEVRGETKAGAAGTARVASGHEVAEHHGNSGEQSRAKRDEFLYAARDCEADRDFDGAIRYYRKALELDRRNYLVMNNISGILINQGLHEEGAKYSRDALSVKKDYVPSLVNLGISLAQLGKTAEARDHLLKANNLDASNRYAALNLALLCEKAGDYGEAQKLYVKLCQTEDIQGCLGFARVAENRGERDEAKRTYRKILTLTGADSQAKKLASERLSFLER